jgi:hypothetical protein
MSDNNTENYAVNQSSHRILNGDDDGRQRLSRAQRLRNQLADYFLTQQEQFRLSGVILIEFN